MLEIINEKREVAALFELATGKEVAQHIEELSAVLPPKFGELSNGFPPCKDLDIDKSVDLTGLVTLSSLASTGYLFRSQERKEEYQQKTTRNMQLAIQGRHDEVESFDWKDPALSLAQLEKGLIYMKNKALKKTPEASTFHLEIFVELYTPKKLILDFLALLKQLNIHYLETY